jgi:hypothetical protein
MDVFTAGPFAGMIADVVSRLPFASDVVIHCSNLRHQTAVLAAAITKFLSVD